VWLEPRRSRRCVCASVDAWAKIAHGVILGIGSLLLRWIGKQVQRPVDAVYFCRCVRS
jgi:hypothetical protein